MGELVAELRRRCRTCHGTGVCPCTRTGRNTKSEPGSTWCVARSLEWELRSAPGREPILADELPVYFQDGRTCHVCLGLGSPRPGRWSYDPRRSPTRGSAFARLRRSVIETYLQEHGPLCPGIGRPAHEVPPGALSVDHVVPVAAGGDPVEPSNLRVLCRDCNRRKGDRTLDLSVAAGLLAGDLDDLLTPQEAARLAGCSLDRINAWIRAFEMPVSRWRGGDLRRAQRRPMIRRADLVEVVARHGGVRYPRSR